MESYHFDMTPEQARLARWAGKAALKHLAGVKLREGIKIGEALLIGRDASLKASGANTLRHKGYALAFRQWKRKFHFPDDTTEKGAARFYTDAILIAEHKELADRLIAIMPANRKADMGVPGLAKLIVRNLDAKRRHDADPDKKKEKFKPSFGPWETKRERELQRRCDDLSYERGEWIDANRLLLASLTELIAALEPPMRTEFALVLDLWRHSWDERAQTESDPFSDPFVDLITTS